MSCARFFDLKFSLDVNRLPNAKQKRKRSIAMTNVFYILPITPTKSAARSAPFSMLES